MTKQQHAKLARHYQGRYAQMAAFSRYLHGKLTHQQAQDYADMWAKYVTHKRAGEWNV